MFQELLAVRELLLTASIHSRIKERCQLRSIWWSSVSSRRVWWWWRWEPESPIPCSTTMSYRNSQRPKRKNLNGLCSTCKFLEREKKKLNWKDTTMLVISYFLIIWKLLLIESIKIFIINSLRVPMAALSISLVFDSMLVDFFHCYISIV